MLNFLVAIMFLSFVLGPAWLADLALRERILLARELWRETVIAFRQWRTDFNFQKAKTLLTPHSVPFPQLRSALLRLLLSLPDTPVALWKMLRTHYRQAPARSLTMPEMLTIRGVAPPWY